MKDDESRRPGYTADFQEDQRSVLILSTPHSEIETFFWDNINDLSDPLGVQNAVRVTLSRRGRRVLLRSISAAQKADLPVSPLAIAALRDLESDLEINEICGLIEKLWVEPNIKKGYSLLLDPMAEHDT